ncbi:MAG: thioredoxin family protein [Ramlibacter sp.]|nr:thioredoxin family protein [Ramlibacter sp.]
MNKLNPPALRRRELLALGAASLLAPLHASPTSPAFSLYDEGPAPEFTGIDRWFNSQALSMASLRGKVVLVDFWTFSCVNCIRTLPYVNRWAAEHAAAGLVTVGVHTPEFAHERSADRLQTAMQRLGVKHPVAQDNRYATWKAWRNQYWPAKYLVDRRGRVQFRHVGEGDYERIEATLRLLLSQPS